MKIAIPSPGQIIDLARSLHMSFSKDDAERYQEMMAGIFDAYRIVEESGDELPVVGYPRTPGTLPDRDTNRCRAWSRRVEIPGRRRGPLAGRTVALKDTVMLAGVPMSAGTRFFDGYIPEVDATIVTRILDAGGNIIGKTVCEYLCLSGSSHTSFPEPVRNPWRHDLAAGGSSSGSAVVIATGEADLAIGADQGGSVRIPAAWCGIVGLKPTYGLVPYTGLLPIEMTLDHVGTMSRTVRDNALLLTAIAGHDPLDPRQHPGLPKRHYLRRLDSGVEGLRVGIVREGFDWPVSEAEVDAQVQREAERFGQLGAIVEETSIPIHRISRDIWTPIFVEGCLQLMLLDNGAGNNHHGLFTTSASDAFRRWRQNADDLSPSVKVVMLAAQHLSSTYHGRFYGKSQNLMRRVRGAYDRALAGFDVLVMPTTPMKAQPLPPDSADDREIWDAALGMNINTAPFCSTGHPSLSIPCGTVDGLPVGMMLTGRHHDEETLYRAAHAYETHFGVRPPCVPAESDVQ